jgi:hypothetical protein
METWNLQKVQLTPTEEKFRRFIDAATGHKFPALSQKTTYIFSLYPFLAKYTDKDPDVVRQHVLDNDKPMFSHDDMVYILDTIKKQTDPEYCNMDISEAKGCIKKTLEKQYGGGAEEVVVKKEVINPTYDPYDDIFGATKRPGFVDKSRDGFYDRVAKKLQTMGPTLSHKWDGFFWFVFLLYNLENMDIFGPGFSMALDAYVLGTRVLVDGLDEFLPMVMSFAGALIPGGAIAGTAIGEVIVLVIGNILLLGTVIVSVSRKQFGDAFKNSLGMIPFIGDFLTATAVTAETQLQRANTYRHKYVDMLGSVSPRLERYADYWVPQLEPVTATSPPSLTIDDIKTDVTNKLLEVSGADKVLAQAQALSDDPLKAIGATEQLEKAQALVQDKITEAQTKAQNAVQAQVNKAQTAVQDKITEAQTAVQDKMTEAQTKAQNAVQAQVNKAQTAVQDKMTEAQTKAQNAVKLHGGRRHITRRSKVPARKRSRKARRQ